ncbi:MAG: hypothetical protein PF508_07250 [Spirochaeta sp.]|nr:hypothetical protein [Spirochaeta sp.]
MIIADVVGLGKSIIGSVLGRVTGKQCLVIAPPGLIGDAKQGTGWWGYLEDPTRAKRVQRYLDPLRTGLPEGEVVIAIEHREEPADTTRR